MLKAWCCLEEVPYCFSRSSVKFQGDTGQKNRRFWPNFGVSGLYLKFECTNGYEMMRKAWSNIEEVPYCFSRSSVKFQGHTWQKITDFDQNWVFPDCNSSLNSLMAMKWCTKLEATYKRCPIVFEGHLSNFKVARDEKSPILTQIERFRTVTTAWIHRWPWNDAQSLTWHRRGALLFFDVIHQISRSHRTKKNCRFLPELSVSGL